MDKKDIMQILVEEKEEGDKDKQLVFKVIAPEQVPEVVESKPRRSRAEKAESEKKEVEKID